MLATRILTPHTHSRSSTAFGALRNATGVADGCDIQVELTSQDINQNEIPDEWECIGDLDNSGVVDGADLAILLGAWGPCPGCPADFNASGEVDVADLAILLGAWGLCMN
ncbi:MAG: hypothetical protein JNL80_02335 [Phycisphaerae bacterium]|nr:hypothetical protein [Phycisphaerae bacterium]